jgi:hypothetical protein
MTIRFRSLVIGRPCSNLIPVLALATGLLLAGIVPAGSGQFPGQGAAKDEKAPKVYALLHIVSQPPRILDRPTPGAREGETDQAYERFKRTQAVLMKTRLVANAALRQPRIAELELVKQQKDPVWWLIDNLQVDFPNDSEIMRVWLPGKPSKDLATLVNAVAQAYLAEIINKEKSNQAKHLDMLRGVVSRYDEVLRSKRQALRALAESAGSSNPENLALKQKLALDQLSRVQQELASVTSELRRAKLEIQLEQAREKDASRRAVSEQAISDLMASDTSIKRAEAKLQQKEEQVEALRKRYKYTDEDVILKNAEEQVAAIWKEIADRKEKLRPKLEEEFRERAKAAAAARGAAAQERLSLVESMHATLKEEVSRSLEENKSLGAKHVDLDSYKEEIAQAEAVARRAQAELERMNVEINAPARVRLIEPAEAPAD